ncbi:hypothetical protein BJ165DRAFT_1400871 [Panaeolus papilionaceus]|nr:hypothetical protein BJ165DRAFT_1400871 [Panaeolus papilionaceus]
MFKLVKTSNSEHQTSPGHSEEEGYLQPISQLPAEFLCRIFLWHRDSPQGGQNFKVQSWIGIVQLSSNIDVTSSQSLPLSTRVFDSEPFSRKNHAELLQVDTTEPVILGNLEFLQIKAQPQLVTQFLNTLFGVLTTRVVRALQLASQHPNDSLGPDDNVQLLIGFQDQYPDQHLTGLLYIDSGATMQIVMCLKMLLDALRLLPPDQVLSLEVTVPLTEDLWTFFGQLPKLQLLSVDKHAMHGYLNHAIDNPHPKLVHLTCVAVDLGLQNAKRPEHFF